MSSLRLSTFGTARLRCLAPWVAVSGAAVLGAAALQAAGSSDVERFVGRLPGPVVVTAAGAAGLWALAFLESRQFWRCSTRATTARGIGVAGAATLPFVAVAIGVDTAVGFPSDTNVAWPEAWVLYDVRFNGRTWVLVLTVAATEPVAQAVLKSALLPFVVPHVFLIGVAELLLLRRFGYVPMVAFRLFYYLAWHVLWGEARLALLF